jgi:hypothetical protein
MSKLSRMVIASMVLVAVSAPASAISFLDNWQFNLTGGGLDGSQIIIGEYLNFDGFSFVHNTFPGGGSSGPFNFTDAGVFRVSSSDAGDFIVAAFPGYEMTSIFQATGNGTLSPSTGGSFNFNPGGTLELWAGNVATGTRNWAEGVRNDPAPTPPPTRVIYGANDGQLFATFTLTEGGGNIGTSGVPNGAITTIFTATSVLCGYFFDATGNDLCHNPNLLNFETTNASLITTITTPTANVPPEVVCDLANINCPTGKSSGTGAVSTPPFNLLIGNGGQLRLALPTPVPEPGTLVLVGLGLGGLGIRRFRRYPQVHL